MAKNKMAEDSFDLNLLNEAIAETIVKRKSDAEVFANSSPLEQKLLDHGLVNVSKLDTLLKTDLRYASSNNFLNEVLYDGLKNCYLQAEVANMVLKAQEILQQQTPNQSLLLLDCVRPQSVQYKMWDKVENTNKKKYVAHPKQGSMHNFGVAIDVTIVDEEGKELDMGTPFDYFGELAQPRHNHKFIQSGELSPKQLTNRVRLRAIMKKAGFKSIDTEWWHFVAFDKNLTRKKYQIVP